MLLTAIPESKLKLQKLNWQHTGQFNTLLNRFRRTNSRGLFFFLLKFIRAGGWRGRPGSYLCCDTDGKLPVDSETKCRGGEHGKNRVTFKFKAFFFCYQIFT